MIYSFRNRKILIQSTIPLARNLANMLSSIVSCSQSDSESQRLETKEWIIEILKEIEKVCSINGGAALASHAEELIKEIENKNDCIEQEKIELLLDELDMQHYHASINYQMFESKNQWLTWYKLTPNMSIQNETTQFFINSRNNIEKNIDFNNKSNVDTMLNNLIQLYIKLKDNINSIYDLFFISLLIDRLKNETNKDLLSEVFNYVYKFIEEDKIDARAWSILLWSANQNPSEFIEKLMLNEEEDSLFIFDKKDITEEISVEISPFIKDTKWPSWKALEGDFISVSELLDVKEIHWEKVIKHLEHIVSQSLKDDKIWNPGIFIKELALYLEKNPNEYEKWSGPLIQRLALWKDALLKRDPLAILNWVNIALLAKKEKDLPMWENWFKLDLDINNKIEQEIIYEIQEDLIKNESLAISTLEALGLDFIVEIIKSINNIDNQYIKIKNGLMSEILFWAYEKQEVSLFFGELIKEETNTVLWQNNILNYLEDCSSTIEIKEEIINQVDSSAEDEEFTKELFIAIVTDAKEMINLLDNSIIEIYKNGIMTSDYVRSMHSFKSLSLNLNNNYTANYYYRVENWAIKKFENAKKLTEKELEIVFTSFGLTKIIITRWEDNQKVESLPIKSTIDFFNDFDLSMQNNIKNLEEEKNDKKIDRKTLNYNKFFVNEQLVDDEIDNVDYDIFVNFKEEAEDLFNKLDNSLVDVRGNIEEINRYLHTLKGGSRISGLMKLGLWVHQIEDVTTKKIQNISVEELKNVLQYAFDKARNLFSNAILDFKQQGVDITDKDIILKLPLKDIESISDSILSAESAQKKIELSYSNIENVLDRAKEPLRRLNFLVSEIFVESDSLLHAGGKKKKKTKDGVFDELEMDKFTYFHELTRKLEEAVADNDLYHEMLEKTIITLKESLSHNKMWLNIAQKDLQKNLHNEAKNYESRLSATVRSACNELLKQAEIVFNGSSLLIDKKILDEVAPALEHLVRNSVAHSIEIPEIRKQLKKPIMGKINVSASSNVDWFTFSVKDDGNGLNFEKIKQKAIEKELISEGQEISKEELCKIIFSPGFSTATSLSNIAGRGVGLDAVEEMIKKLNGEIKINIYEENKAEFIINIPIPVWLLSGVQVKVQNKTYVISSNQIEDISIHTQEIIKNAIQNNKIIYNNVEKDCLYLDKINHSNDFHKLNNFHPIIHLKNNKSFIVDEIKFIEKQPIKSMPNNLYKNKGISGITILSDSSVGIVLDALAEEWNFAYKEQIDINTKKHDKNANLVLVVDDSLTVRKATTKFLKKEGFDVVTAENGLEALKYIENETLPSFILLDIEMPVMDGFETLQKLKQIEFAKDIPVVIISSRAVDKHINFAKSTGAVDFLGKPFDEEKLSALLNKYIKLKV